MKLPTPVAIAVITGLVTITGSYFTAAATSDSRVNTIDTKVQVLQERQSLQYAEIKEALVGLKQGQTNTDAKVSEILKVVK